MNTRNIHSILAIVALILGSAVAFAHNGVEHVMGSVTAVKDTSITVNTVSHTSVTVLVDATTKFSRNNTAVTWKDVKVGDRVAIDAKENSAKKLVGVTVKLGATAAADHNANKE